MNKPLCLVWDVDDTIIQWTQPFIEWLFHYKINEIDTHDSVSWFSKKYINGFNSSRYFIERKGIPKHINMLNHYKNSCKNIILTACGKENTENMLKCLTTKGLFFETHIVDCSTEKYEHILELSKHYTVVVLDDKRSTLEFCEKNNILSFNLHSQYHNAISSIETILKQPKE